MLVGTELGKSYEILTIFFFNSMTASIYGNASTIKFSLQWNNFDQIRSYLILSIRSLQEHINTTVNIYVMTLLYAHNSYTLNIILSA